MLIHLSLTHLLLFRLTLLMSNFTLWLFFLRSVVCVGVPSVNWDRTLNRFHRLGKAPAQGFNMQASTHTCRHEYTHIHTCTKVISAMPHLPHPRQQTRRYIQRTAESVSSEIHRILLGESAFGHSPVPVPFPVPIPRRLHAALGFRIGGRAHS